LAYRGEEEYHREAEARDGGHVPFRVGAEFRARPAPVIVFLVLFHVPRLFFLSHRHDFFLVNSDEWLVAPPLYAERAWKTSGYCVWFDNFDYFYYLVYTMCVI